MVEGKDRESKNVVSTHELNGSQNCGVHEGMKNNVENVFHTSTCKMMWNKARSYAATNHFGI